MPPDRHADVIRRDFPLRAVPVVPEIRLHCATPSSGLSRLARSHVPPYWAYPWPGGVALARYLLDHPDGAAGRRAFDLGAGGGIVAIAAAMAGAREVTASELDPAGAAALALNAEANGVTLTVVTQDITMSPPPPVDLILIGDLFYERRLAKHVTAFLERCHAAGHSILIGDIGRPFLPRSQLRQVAEYAVAEFGQSTGKTRPCAVYAFSP